MAILVRDFQHQFGCGLHHRSLPPRCPPCPAAQYSRMSVQYRTAGATAAARQLLKLALDSGSTDDVTVVVTVFGWRPEDAEDGGVGN